jgi:hypothetical protein
LLCVFGAGWMVTVGVFVMPEYVCGDVEMTGFELLMCLTCAADAPEYSRC